MADSKVSASLGHMLLQPVVVPVASIKIVSPYGTGYGGVEAKRTHLKPICDIGVDFVDKANTIIEHARSLTGLQRGLEAIKKIDIRAKIQLGSQVCMETEKVSGMLEVNTYQQSWILLP